MVFGDSKTMERGCARGQEKMRRGDNDIVRLGYRKGK